MMNAGAVSQPAAAEALDRARNTGRQTGTENDEAAFQGLLAKLLGSGERPRDETAAAARDKNSGDGDPRKILGWLTGNAEALGLVDAAGGQEHALPPQDGSAAQAPGLNALLQALVTNGALAGGLSAIAARVADGTVTEAETALMQAAAAAQANGDDLTTEQLVLASLARAMAPRSEGGGDGDGMPSALLTVLRRETHFAPVADVNAGLASRVATLREGQPVVDSPDDAGPIQSGNGLEARTSTRLALLHAAVTAPQGVQPGAERQEGVLPMAEPEPQTAADERTGTGDPIFRSEQAVPTGRSDALVNSGLAAGGVAQQIADRVASEASAPSSHVARSDAPAFAVKHDSAVKVLHIQLQPADLGTVSIRLSVKDQTLRLDLDVGRGDTAHLIQRDREALSALLRSAGYVIDGMEIRIIDQSGGGAQANNQGNMQMPGGGQPGSSHADARSQGERPHDGHRQNSFGNGRNGEAEQAGPTHRRSGTYL